MNFHKLVAQMASILIIPMIPQYVLSDDKPDMTMQSYFDCDTIQCKDNMIEAAFRNRDCQRIEYILDNENVIIQKAKILRYFTLSYYNIPSRPVSFTCSNVESLLKALLEDQKLIDPICSYYYAVEPDMDVLDSLYSLMKENRKYATYCMGVLIKYNYEPAYKDLIYYYKTSSTDTSKQYYLSNMLEVDFESAKSVVEGVLRNEEYAVLTSMGPRIAYLYNKGSIPYEFAMKVLFSMLQHPDYETRRRAAVCIGEIGNDVGTVERLQSIMRSSHAADIAEEIQWSIHAIESR